MNEYKDFSSLPPEQERSFVPFERASIENGKKAWIIAFIACAVFFATVLVVINLFEPPPPKMEDEDLGGLKPAAAKQEKAEPKAEEPAAKEEAEEAAAGDEADETAAEEGEAEGEE